MIDKIILLDIGNTYSHLFIISGKLKYKEVLTKKIKVFLKNYILKNFLIYASCVVDEIERDLKKFMSVKFLKTKDLACFIKVRYNLKQLGIDRLCAAVATKEICGRNTAIISLGTCITMDFLNSKGQFLGGQIFPGILLIAKALSDYTSRLPNVLSGREKSLKIKKIFSKNSYFGQNTEEVIINGISNFVFSGIENFIKRLKPKKIIFTGGYAQLTYRRYSLKKVNLKIFARRNLVLLGIAKYCLAKKVINKSIYYKLLTFCNDI